MAAELKANCNNPLQVQHNSLQTAW
jgi:hypothetical protein